MFDDSGKTPPSLDDPNLAWFVVTATKPHSGYYARTCSANGTIHPALILAAYAMNWRTDLKIHNEVVIWSKADLPTHWGQAVDGVGALMSSQESQLKLSRKVTQALPEGGPIVWREVKLDGPLPNNAAPPKVVNNLFTPAERDETMGLVWEWGTQSIPRLYMMAAVMLEHHHKAAVAALAVDKGGAIREYGIKRATDGGCRHGEVQMVFGLKGALPEGGAVFTTLKPCCMCASLIQACDPDGKIRKYWVRDDPTSGANWKQIDQKFTLTNGALLDKRCQMNGLGVKGLKLSENRDFAAAFTTARTASENMQMTDVPKETIKAWYDSWVTKAPLPAGACTKSNVKNGGDKNAVVAALKEKGPGGIDTANGQDLVVYDSSAKGKNWRGWKKPEIDLLKDKWAAQKKFKFEEFYPKRIIEVIAYNPGSTNLREATRQAFLGKVEKYKGEQARFKNNKVKAVLEYLVQFLSGEGVKLT